MTLQRQEARTFRFTGTSKDLVGFETTDGAALRTDNNNRIPYGSTFLNLDSGQLSMWDGVKWVLISESVTRLAQAQIGVMREVLEEMQTSNKHLEAILLTLNE